VRDPVDPDTHTPETPESQPARPPQSDPAGWLLGGRYRVVDRLGRGGMAEVFRAHDDLLDRDVAVKVFRTVMDGDADTHGEVRRELELQSLARLSHPNLITLFDGSVAGDGPAYLVLELVHGPDLSSRIKEGPLPEREAREIGAQIADALAYVHARGMVHRDVKPANILLGIDEGLPLPGTIRARLSDFGIVRMIGSSRMTAADLTLGTASYVAPEQARGADVGPPADVYALGLVLIEALTGVRCFDGPIHEALAARLASSPQIPAHLPSPWPELLAAMTAQDPDARPDAAEVTRGLREGVVPDVGAAAAAAGAALPDAAIAGAAIAGAAPAAAAPLDAAPVGAGTTAPISPVSAVVPASAAAAGLAAAGSAADATGATSALGAASAGPPPPVVVPAGADWDEARPPRRRPRRGAILLLAAAAFAAVLAGAGFLLLGGSGNSPADSTPTLTTGSSSASTSAHKSTVSQAAVVQTKGSATPTDRSSGKTSAHRTATTQASTSTRAAGPTTSTSRSTAPAGGGGGGAGTSSSSSSSPTASTSPTTPSPTSPNGTGAPAGAVASPIPTP
jgi:hypothetical protein